MTLDRSATFPLPTGEAALLDAARYTFANHWQQITFGVRLPGADWDIAAPRAPYEIVVVDGHLIVSFGSWAFRVCVDDSLQGTTERVARAELFRTVENGEPVGWGMRWFNADDAQLLNVNLPHPWLDAFGQPLLDPNWTHLDAWNGLRLHLFGLEPDPFDLTCTLAGAGFPELVEDEPALLAARAVGPTYTALVCRGCCCGQEQRADTALAQLAAIRSAATRVDGARVRVTNCLGPCSEANVVVVRHRDAALLGERIGTTWLGNLADDDSMALLTSWLGDGASLDCLPAGLAAKQIDLDAIMVLPEHEMTRAISV